MKNYADIYASVNDASAVEQRWYAKIEGTRGTLAAPTNTDFFYALPGGTISYTQPNESSPQRSGRHHLTPIQKKKELTFSFSTYFNIDTSLGAASTSEIDAAIRLLYRSMLGKEDVTGGSPVYNTETAPEVTMSLYECGDKWAHQARGCVVDGLTQNFVGNGESTSDWSGFGAEAYTVGIAKSTTDNNAGNTITLVSGEEDRIPVGAFVMIIEADGTTRSGDTPNGSPRLVTAKTSNVITVNGAVLADADGSGVGTPIYIAYYEPATPTAINDPVTGLVGSFTIASTTVDCIRNATITMTNEHEKVDYCYGYDALSGTIFVPGSRFTAEVSIELNLNDDILQLFNRISEEFETQDITLVLGSASGRRYELAMPRVVFSLPAFTVPETGSIPITFVGTAYETVEDAADEVTASFL